MDIEGGWGFARVHVKWSFLPGRSNVATVLLFPHTSSFICGVNCYYLFLISPSFDSSGRLCFVGGCGIS